MNDKLEFNIYSDTFRGARILCDILIRLTEDRGEKINVVKRADLFVVDMADYRFNFKPLSTSKMFKTDKDDRILELENAIKNHRTQKLDDRCWLDDQELYKVLNDGNLGDNSTPDMNEMLENCKNYLTKRCNPNNKWKTYQELEEENKKLRNKIYELEIDRLPIN